MVVPKKNPIIRWVLHHYVQWTVRRHFNELRTDPVDIDNSRSVLLVANHFSYWDSLILYIICFKFLKKKFHVMVRKDTTPQLKYLRFGGAFSISKNSRDMLQSLHFAAELLNDPQNLVLIFPQGKLYSNFVNEINFEKGLVKIMNEADGKFQLVFAATFIQYLKHKKPTATVYLKSQDYQKKSPEDLNNAYQIHYQNTKLQQTEIVI
jgi:1-acyl-sn-glycerol-3-phosphate acyltransferase